MTDPVTIEGKRLATWKDARNEDNINPWTQAPNSTATVFLTNHNKWVPYWLEGNPRTTEDRYRVFIGLLKVEEGCYTTHENVSWNRVGQFMSYPALQHDWHQIDPEYMASRCCSPRTLPARFLFILIDVCLLIRLHHFQTIQTSKRKRL